MTVEPLLVAVAVGPGGVLVLVAVGEPIVKVLVAVKVAVGGRVWVGVAVGPQWGNCTEVVFSVPQAPMVIGPSTTTLPLASVSWK